MRWSIRNKQSWPPADLKALHAKIGELTLAIVHRLEHPPHRCFVKRDAELIGQPLHQVDQPPAHHFVHGRDRAPLNDVLERLALLFSELRLRSRCLEVDQSLQTPAVEPQSPVPDTLQRHPADQGRLAARAALVNLCQRQQPPGLAAVLRSPCQPPQPRRVKIPAKPDPFRHGKPPVCHGESVFASSVKWN